MLLLSPPSQARPAKSPAGDLDGRLADPAWRHAHNPVYFGGVAMRVRSRNFTGLTAVVKDLHIDGEFEVDCSAPFWRLLVVLDEVGGHLRVRTADGQVVPQPDVPHAMFLTPPNTSLRGFADGLRYVRHLSLQFDYERLGLLFEERQPPPIPAAPRLGFFEPRVYGLARLFEAECGRDDGDDDLGDSLTVNVLSLLSDLDDFEPEPLAGDGLTPRQLRRVNDYLQAQLANPVRPVDLARLLGMSRSHFCRAFKISTGLPPHAWLMSLRVRRARELMMSGRSSLVDVALNTGFADQPHFTRVFTRFAGVTPGEWRRQWSN